MDGTTIELFMTKSSRTRSGCQQAAPSRDRDSKFAAAFD